MSTALEAGQKTFAQNTAAPQGGTPAATPAVGLNRRVIQLSSAALLAIQTTAITLLPAPGAGFKTIPICAIIEMIAGSAAYTDAGGAVSFTQGSWTQALAANTVFTAAANQRNAQIIDFAALGTSAASPTYENAALTLAKATNNFAAGNGVATVTIYYMVEPVNPALS